ncbi:MAG: aspartate kinase [Planctomycetes bacterium]|nr:aspartate kinase [Planctomycetota bacterium]MBU1518811.1 aspartate kinase [Planctomycetota bacterium]MBU2458247.1 aspartate kinase [Planctomycetota bacterium]MBU2596610.1 aspartate kinase [Planctomycetota bacterium]
MSKKKKIIVQKFGGTSVATAEKIKKAAQRAIDEFKRGKQVVMVASARGKQTDELIADAMELNPNPPKREMDQLLSTGEQQTVSLVAMAIEAMGFKAISLTGAQVGMVTDSVHTKARIKSIDAGRIKKHLNAGNIVIVAGFQGIDENENITTLGRGGSDTSAVALAAALKADTCDIYTDVDGVYTTDPRIFKKAVKLEQISYDEVLEMASLGAGVLHGRSIEFGKKYDVTIHVRSSLSGKKGTLITHEVPKMEGILVSGATIEKKLAKVSMIGVSNKPGNAAKVFAHLAKAKVSVNDIIQTEVSKQKANISFTVSKNDFNDTKKAVEKIKGKVGCDNVFYRDDIAEVSIIGVGMRTHYGVANMMFSTLAKGKINIDSITTSEIRISCIVDKGQAEKALNSICKVFELDKPVNKRSYVK